MSLQKMYFTLFLLYTSFSRSFTLHETVSADSITAEYDKGILKVHLPKIEEAKQKPVKEIAVS